MIEQNQGKAPAFIELTKKSAGLSAEEQQRVEEGAAASRTTPLPGSLFPHMPTPKY